MARLEIWGNQTTMNLENVLHINIQASPYFKDLSRLTTFYEVVDEIYNEVQSAAPWAVPSRKVPSTSFCLLFKLFTLRPNMKQIQQLLDHPDSPFIRTTGFLYLRYVCPPKYLWEWFEPYLDDEEEFSLTPQSKPIKMGKFVKDLLGEQRYFETLLPRIPVPVMKDLQPKLKEYESQHKSNTKDNNKDDRDKGRHLETDTKRSRSRSRSRGRGKSKDRERRGRSRSRSKEKERRGRSSSRDRNRNKDRARDRERTRDKDTNKDRNKDRDKDRHSKRSWSRSRSRSTERRRKRSRSRSHSKERNSHSSRHRSRESRSPSRSPEIKKAKTEDSDASKSSLNKIIAMYVTPDVGKNSTAVQNSNQSETILLGFKKS